MSNIADTAPKVFVSHASEDKVRFVTQFAKKLREHGIDAWLDKWEMLPGDSLVDKIFEEGIKQAQAVIVVVSKFSVSKPWVREELNASFVKRINDGSKLIPVVIETCDVPEALKSTVWERVTNLDSYEEEFNRIVSSIFGSYDKPQLGQPPAYTQSTIFVPPGYTKYDVIILKSIAKKYIEKSDYFMQIDDLYTSLDGSEIQLSEFNESLTVLRGRGLIGLHASLRSNVQKKDAYNGISVLHIEDKGLNFYIDNFVPEYPTIALEVATELVNNQHWHLNSIATSISRERMLVNNVLLRLLDEGLIQSARTITGECATILGVSPELNRRLRQQA